MSAYYYSAHTEQQNSTARSAEPQKLEALTCRFVHQSDTPRIENLYFDIFENHQSQHLHQSKRSQQVNSQLPEPWNLELASPPTTDVSVNVIKNA